MHGWLKEKLNKADNLPFARMCCGCIGIPLGNCVYIAIVNCDSDNDKPNPSFDVRVADHPEFTFITREETEAIIDDLHSAVADGHRFRELRAIIKGMAHE